MLKTENRKLLFPKDNLGPYDVLYDYNFVNKLLIEFHSSELVVLQGQIMLIGHLWSIF